MFSLKTSYSVCRPFNYSKKWVVSADGFKTWLVLLCWNLIELEVVDGWSRVLWVFVIVMLVRCFNDIHYFALVPQISFSALSENSQFVYLVLIICINCFYWILLFLILKLLNFQSRCFFIKDFSLWIIIFFIFFLIL